MSVSLTVIESAQNLPVALGPDLAAAVDLAKAEKAARAARAINMPYDPEEFVDYDASEGYE